MERCRCMEKQSVRTDRRLAGTWRWKREREGRNEFLPQVGDKSSTAGLISFRWLRFHLAERSVNFKGHSAGADRRGVKGKKGGKNRQKRDGKKNNQAKWCCHTQTHTKSPSVGGSLVTWGQQRELTASYWVPLTITTALFSYLCTSQKADRRSRVSTTKKTCPWFLLKTAQTNKPTAVRANLHTENVQSDSFKEKIWISKWKKKHPQQWKTLNILL